MTHAHITSWLIALILFVIAWSLTNSGKERAAKILQMVLRLFYIFIVVTGIMLLMKIDPTPLYHVKAVMGFIVISFMELAMVKKSKEKPASVYLLLFVLFFIATVSLGFYLPLGAKWF